MKGYESSIFRITILLFFDRTVSALAEIENETTCTYQDERHFQPSERADLSCVISKCTQLKLYRTLTQCRMSFSSRFFLTQSIKTSWCDRVTRPFGRLKSDQSPKRKTLKNSNEGTTIIFGSLTGHDLYFKSIKLSLNEVIGKRFILYNLG